MNITFPVLPEHVAPLMLDPFQTPGGILYHSTNDPSSETLYRARFPQPPEAPIQMPTAHRQTTLVFTKGGRNPSLRDAIQVGWRSFELPTVATEAVGSRLIHEDVNNVPELEEFVVGPHAEGSLRAYLSLSRLKSPKFATSAERAGPVKETLPPGIPQQHAYRREEARTQILRRNVPKEVTMIMKRETAVRLAPPVGKLQFEYIFMLIPCLYVATVWLHGNNGQNLFYSLQPTNFYRQPVFERGGVLTEKQYFADISKLMQRRHL